MERHGICTACFQGVHEYPATGWQHGNLGGVTAHPVPNVVKIPATDTRADDQIIGVNGEYAYIAAPEDRLPR